MTFEASAPGRCGIVGNPSDIYGGVVVSCSVPARASCRLTLGARESLPQDLTLWNAATARFPLKTAVKVEWKSDIPRSSGLAGSTALLAATVACVAAAAGQPDPVNDLIGFSELVRDVERHEAGVMCGFQDAYMAVFGGLNRLDFQGKTPALDSQIGAWVNGSRGLRGKVEGLEAPLPFLVITTGVERLSGSVHGPIADRWLRGDTEIVSAMEHIAKLGEAGATAIKRQDWISLAKSMTENQEIVAAYGGSGEAIDFLIERCMRRGASAAKLAGAGLGGTVIALTENALALEQGLREDGYGRFLQPAAVAGLSLDSES